MDLDDWGPIVGSIGATVRNRGKVAWKDGRVEVGVWECDAGRFRAVFAGRGELFQVVSGRLTGVGEDGTRFEAGPGAACTFPSGWSGEWEVHEPLRQVCCEFRTED